MPDLTMDQSRAAVALIARLESPDVQEHLRPGYEMDFANSVLEQWNDRNWISFEGHGGKRPQYELLMEIVERAEERAVKKTSRGGSRRYEGFK